MALAHLHSISWTLAAGAYSENINIQSGGLNLKLITLTPANLTTSFTFKITSPTGQVIKQLTAKGRVSDAIDIPMSGIYTLAITGATLLTEIITGELTFEH